MTVLLEGGVMVEDVCMSVCVFVCVCVCVCVCVFLCAYVSVNIVPTVAADDAWPERKSELA